MDVREDGAIGTHNFGVSSHSHVWFGIADRLAVRCFQTKTQPDEMIGGERRGAALPNHLVTIRQGRGGVFWLVAEGHHYYAAVGIAMVVRSGDRRGKG